MTDPHRRRSFREQHEGKPLELPASDLPTLAEGLECERLGCSLVALRAMTAQQRAERATSRRASLRGKRDGAGFSLGSIPGLDDQTELVMRPPMPAAAPVVRRLEPIALSLPWSAMLPDNAKHLARGDRMFLTQEYRIAKAKAVDAIRSQLPAGWEPFGVPVAFRLVFIEPNRSSRRDILNYQKLVCDAMTGLVYADDSLIDDHHWTRGTPDIDRPRADISVCPIATGIR